MTGDHYLLSRPEYPCRWMKDAPFIKGLYWRDGAVFTAPVPNPLTGFVLKKIKQYAADHGPEVPPYFLESMPLFREDVLVAMRECGVTNLDAYDTVIEDPETGTKITNYKAVNIVGLGSIGPGVPLPLDGRYPLRRGPRLGVRACVHHARAQAPRRLRVEEAEPRRG